MYVVSYTLFTYFYLFSKVLPALKHTSMFLQPMLWQEKLWKQEWDSIRPCDHWQVGLLRLQLFLCFVNGEWVSEWVCVWVTKWMSDWVDEQAHGWDREQMSSLPVCQTAQLGWLASYSSQCGNCGWFCVSGWGASFPGTCALRGGHHLDRVCSITGGSITRGSCWEYT